MTERVYLQSAFVLHRRQFRETSLLVDFFTREHGRICALAKGVRTPRSKRLGLLEPFVPLVISWAGKSELVTLAQLEPAGHYYSLVGRKLVSALYINELLMHLLKVRDPNQELFDFYRVTLSELSLKDDMEVPLRLFEKRLLQSMGYGLLLTETVDTGEPIVVDEHYRFEPTVGFYKIDKDYIESFSAPHKIFSGATLLELSRETLATPETQQEAKRLMRLALLPYLEGKSIKTRELYLKSVTE